MKEKLLAEDLWLSYFNRYLFEKAVITEKEFNRMTEKISLRRSDVCCGGRCNEAENGKFSALFYCMLSDTCFSE